MSTGIVRGEHSVQLMESCKKENRTNKASESDLAARNLLRDLFELEPRLDPDQTQEISNSKSVILGLRADLP